MMKYDSLSGVLNNRQRNLLRVKEGLLESNGPGMRDGRELPSKHFVPISFDRAGKIGLPWVAFLVLHIPIALLMQSSVAISTVHALITLAVGILCALSGRRIAWVAYTGAYL